MRYVAAYMLAAMGATKSHGHQEHQDHIVTVTDIENILGSVGVDCDKSMAENVVKRLSGRQIEDVIAQGMLSLSTLSGSPGMGGAPAAAASGDSGATEAAKPEEKKESKKEEKKEEESDDDMGFGLFD